jgi:hypothetical protein
MWVIFADFKLALAELTDQSSRISFGGTKTRTNTSTGGSDRQGLSPYNTESSERVPLLDPERENSVPMVLSPTPRQFQTHV